MRQGRARSEPPPAARWLVRRCCHPLEAEAVLGDLHEEFHRRSRMDVNVARSWYWSEAVRTGGRLGAHRLGSSLEIRTVCAVAAGVIVTLGWLALTGALGIPELLSRTSVSTQLLVGAAVFVSASGLGGYTVGRLAPAAPVLWSLFGASIFLFGAGVRVGSWIVLVWVAAQLVGAGGGAWTGSRNQSRRTRAVR